VLVYMRDGTAGVPISALPEGAESGTEAARTRAWREVGLGAQILKDLGIVSIRNLSSAERDYIGLSGFGIGIEATEPVES
jgi:3,4-dihydroxy 2-butanone 4-phosphate synthase/GTP cyclohydrolase II